MDIDRDRKRLEPYGRNTCFHPGVLPEAVVSVKNAQEIRKMVQEANRTGKPLIPVSSSGRHRKGGSTPGVPGCTMLDLSGMDQIISISRKHRMAVVEPGVTYPRLQKALAEEGLMLAQPLALRPGKSVAAAVLERVPNTNVNRNWNYVDPISCCGVIWGDGVQMGTGESFGGSFDPRDQQALGKFQMNGPGPMMVDYSRILTGSMGTMGVVAWTALHCVPLPERRKLYYATAADFGGIRDFLYGLLHKRCADALFAMNRTQLAALLGAPDRAPSLPKWTAVACLDSRPLSLTARIDAYAKMLVQTAGEAGVSLCAELLGLDDASALRRIFEGDPEVYWKDAATGASADVFFQTTLDRAQDFLMDMERAAAAQDMDPGRVGVTIQPRHTGTSCQVEFTIPYTPGEENAAHTLFDRLSAVCSQNGAYFQEPYGGWAKLQFDRDPKGADMLRRIKHIFDPRGILNPRKLCF